MPELDSCPRAQVVEAGALNGSQLVVHTADSNAFPSLCCHYCELSISTFDDQWDWKVLDQCPLRQVHRPHLLACHCSWRTSELCPAHKAAAQDGLPCCSNTGCLAGLLMLRSMCTWLQMRADQPFIRPLHGKLLCIGTFLSMMLTIADAMACSNGSGTTSIWLA